MRNCRDRAGEKLWNRKQIVQFETDVFDCWLQAASHFALKTKGRDDSGRAEGKPAERQKALYSDKLVDASSWANPGTITQPLMSAFSGVWLPYESALTFDTSNCQHLSLTCMQEDVADWQPRAHPWRSCCRCRTLSSYLLPWRCFHAHVLIVWSTALQTLAYEMQS